MQKLTDEKGGRIAIVAGIRTPFVKKNTTFGDSCATDLGAMVTNELLNRVPIERQRIDKFIFGQVIQQPDVPNLSREIALILGMPQAQAYTLSSSCITGLQAVGNIVNGIVSRSISIGVAGGADSISNAPLGFNLRVGRILRDILKTSSYRKKWLLLNRLSLSDFKIQSINLRDHLTNRSLAQVSERMAQNFSLSRRELDAYSLRSHQLATHAWNKGYLNNEVMVAHPTPYEKYVLKDNMIRSDCDAQDYAQKKTIVREKRAVTTNWNISASADGAAAVLLMREDQAKSLGVPVLGYIRSFAISGNEVWQNMLSGSVYASSLALERAGMTVKDIDLIDMHESSAAQVLSNLCMFGSQSFAQQHLHRDRALGCVDMDKFNILGGSLAYGSPRAITSLRILIQSLNALQRQGGGVGLVTSSALGGLGAAMIVESE